MKPLGKAYWEVRTKTSYTFYVAVILHINNASLPYTLHIAVFTRVKIYAFIPVSSKSRSMSDVKRRSLLEAVMFSMYVMRLIYCRKNTARCLKYISLSRIIILLDCFSLTDMN